MLEIIIKSPDFRPPPGYGIFEAKKWGDPLMVAEAGLSTSADYFNTSNFQVVPVYVQETDTFSATAGNHSYYSRAKGDMDAIWNLQPKDGRTPEENFNPIIYTGNYTATMWTNSTLTWKYAAEWVAGTQLYGGQLFAASLDTFQVLCKPPALAKELYVTCRKVLPFRRSDFQYSHQTHPWLINKYTVAFRKPKEDTYSETFNGLVRYLPMQVLDPRDFRFAGGKAPKAFFTPVSWSVYKGV